MQERIEYFRSLAFAILTGIFFLIVATLCGVVIVWLAGGWIQRHYGPHAVAAVGVAFFVLTLMGMVSRSTLNTVRRTTQSNAEMIRATSDHSHAFGESQKLAREVVKARGKLESQRMKLEDRFNAQEIREYERYRRQMDRMLEQRRKRLEAKEREAIEQAWWRVEEPYQHTDRLLTDGHYDPIHLGNPDGFREME